MTRKDFEELFLTDKDGYFVNLVIPAEGDSPELNLIGKNQKDLSLDEVVRLKKYAQQLLEKINEQ